MKQTNIRRGDLFWVDFDPSVASEIKKTRPSLICSHDLMNQNSSRVIIAPITSNLKKVYPFEFVIKNVSEISGKIMFDQLRSIDKRRLKEKIGSIPVKYFSEIDNIIKFLFSLQ